MKKFTTDDDLDQFLAGNTSLDEANAGQPGDELVERFIGKIQSYERAKDQECDAQKGSD